MAQIQWFPGHMAKAKREIAEKIKLIDIVVELVDARAPYSSKNPLFNGIVNNKPRLIVMTKEDLANPEITKKWIQYYKDHGYYAMSVNLKQFNEYKKIIQVCKEILKDKMEREAKKGLKPRAMRAMVLGIPNVGKSTFINSLAGKTAAKTGNKPGVTRGNQWIKIDKQLELLDTPGILWPKFDDEAIGMKLACVGSISDEVLNMQEIAYHLLSYGKANYNQLFEARYGAVPQPDDERDNEIVLWMENIARQRGCLKRGAETDFDKVSAQITDDFRSGRIGKVSLEVPKQA